MNTERRVFTIDVGDMKLKDAKIFIERIKKEIRAKRNPIK